MASRAAGSRLPDLGPRGEGWVLGQFIVIGLLIAASVPSLGRMWPRTPLDWAAIAIGAVAIAVAAGAVLLAFRDLGRSLTPVPRPRDDAVLVEHGIYAWIRHPIYAGLILGAFGWSAVTRSLPTVGVVLLLAIYFDLKARREEAWLRERYPEYAAYARRTRRFVPRIY